MSEHQSISQIQDDEIDLIELAINLWQEKWVIVSITVLITIVGAILGIKYDAKITPSYKAEAQLMIPSSTELRAFNQTDYFNISNNQAFKEFISVLESDKHKNNLLNEQSSTQESIEKSRLTKIITEREIEYPNTSVDISSITPDKYFATYQSGSENDTIFASQLDLSLAKKTAIENIQAQYITALELKIQQLERTDIVKKNILNDRFNAEIEFIKGIGGNISDNHEVLSLRKEIALLKQNHLAEQLKAILNHTTLASDIQFYHPQNQVQKIIAKPKKLLVVIMSILFGGILGILIALGRVSYKNRKLKINES